MSETEQDLLRQQLLDGGWVSGGEGNHKTEQDRLRQQLLDGGWTAGRFSEDDIPEPVEESPGLIETAGKGVAHGFLGLGESIGTGVEYLGNRVGSEGMARAGETAKYFWKDKAEQYSPSASISGKNVWDNPELLKNAEWWVYNISDMVPALASSIIPGAGAAKGAQAISVLAKFAPMIGAGVGGLAGGALEGAQTYNAVLEKGGTEEEAARAGELMTAGASVLNALSVGKVLSKAGTTFKGKVLKHLGAGAWEGLTEGLEEPTEVFSKYFGAYLAGEPLPENLTEDLIQSAKEALTVAPIAALTGIGGSVMAGNKDKLPSEAEPEKDPDGVVGETNPEDALSNDPEKAARANAENDKILNAVINGEDEYWKQQEDIILGQRTQQVEKNKKANEPPSLFERNQQTIDDMGRWQSRNLDVPKTDERAWKDLEGEEKYWSEQRRLIEEQRKGPSQIQKNQARIDATLSDEEQVTRDRNQAMAGKSDFLQKLDMMQAEVNGSQTRGVNQEKVGQQSETVVFGASSPNWMQNIQEARKKRGEPLLSRNDLNVLFNKTRSGQPLTERQRNQYLDLEQEINTYTGDAGEFVEQEKADEFEHKGFEVYGGQQMPVSNLNTGDVFQGTVNGESGEFTVKSIDENGVATIQGKENHQVDISDSVAVDAVKRSRVEGIGPVSKAELKQEGYDVFPGKKEISVTDLNEGDKIVGTIDGVKDEYTVKGVNDSGEVLFQDGITRRLDMFDEVSIDGIKRNDNTDNQKAVPAQPEEMAKEQVVATDAVKPIDNQATDSLSPTVKKNLTVAPGTTVTWQNKKGETLTGELTRPPKEGGKTWRVRKPDGKTTLVHEKDLKINDLKRVTEKPQIEPIKQQSNKKSEQDQGIRSKTAKPNKEQSSKPIEDFGEKIEGARKDYAFKIGKAKEMDTAKNPFSKTFPEPKYQDLINKGIDPYVVGVIRAMRDAVPNKPRKAWALKKWVKQVDVLRDFADDLMTGKISKEKFVDGIRTDHNSLLGPIHGRAELYEIFGHNASLKGIKFEKNFWSVYKGEKNVTKWQIMKEGNKSAFSNMPRILGEGNTKEEAVADFKQRYESFKNEGKGHKKVNFQIYQYRDNPGTHWIGKKVGRNYINLKGFESGPDARKYLSENYDSLVNDLERHKYIPDTRRQSNEERIGEDHRQGKDVTPEMFTDAFGFRGVQFGRYVGKTNERQNALNNAYDALMDLAGILNIPTQAISLGGELGLAFGARGKGGKNAAAAHYEPRQVVINLTKKQGAGSLAHEWWHSLDNYFSRLRKQPDKHLSEHPYRRTTNPADEIRQEMIDAFKAIENAYSETEIQKRSVKLDAKRTKAYWGTKPEITARIFEQYIINKLAENGNLNDYLANIAGKDEFLNDLISNMGDPNFEAEGYYPYLTESETDGVGKAFDKFFKAIKTKKTDKGTALYSASTDRNPGDSIDLEEIKSQYPGQQVTANKDGSLSIRFKNGKGVRIKTVEHIGGDDYRFAVQSGRMAKNGTILGKYQGGEITLNENMAGLETAIHENLHLLVDLGILNKLDLAALDNHRKKLVEAGEYRYEIQEDLEENQANTLAQLINDRDKYRNRSVLHRVIQKVVDFLDALVNIGRQSARKLAREYESGAIYGREAINAPKKGVPNMSVSSDRIDGDSFSVPDNSTLSEDFQYNVIDILSPVSKVYKAIKKSIPEKADFRLKEQLRVSKAKGDINEAEKKFFEPIKRLIGIHKLTVADVDEFLYARHAPEANVRLRLTNARYYLNKLANAQKGSRLKNQIKVIDAKFELEGIPTADVQAAYKTILEQELRKAESEKELKVKEDWEKFSEKPSGMTDKEAAEFSKKWSENKAMPKIARLFDQMNDEGLKISHEAGRLSHEEYEAVKGTFDYYAPLHREGNETKRAFMGIGMGVTNLGTDVKARGGSTKRAVHLLANAMVNHEKNIINARKAEVARAFLEFVKMNPNKNFWEFEETKTKVAYDSKGNIRRIVTFNIEPHQVRVKADGKTHIISANPGNVHAMRILDIIQGNQHKAAPIIGALSMFNRILASVNTTLNPEFIISNFARDLQTAALNLEDTEVAKMRKQIFKSLPNSIKGLYSYVRGDGSHEWAKIAKQYESSGAKIGWIDYGRDIESKVKKLESQIDLHRDGHTTKKSIKKFFTVVEDYNSIAENAVRLATFKAGIDAGMSEAKAAIMAKGLTVNFNQKGAQGTVINSLYLFANAGIQGSTRIIKTLKNNPRRMAKVLGGATATAAGLAMANSIIGGEDDDGNNYYDQIDDHLKARNIIFMIPGTNGKFAKIPLPWGYNVFWALGTEIGDAIVKDDYQPLEGVSRMIATTMDAFNPLQSASIAQTLSPTIGDPFVQVAENKTFFGGPLMPEGNPFSKTPTPDSERYWNSVRPISKGIATGVNWLTGGNKIKPGLMDVSPETLDLVFDTFTGGAGRFAADLFLFPVRSVTGDLTLPDVPMARRLLGSKSEYKISSDYRKNITHVFRLKEQAEEYPERIKELRQDKTFYLLGLAKKSEKSIKKFRNFLKKTKSPEVKSRLEKQIEKTQQAFNKAFIIRRGE